MQTRQTKAKFKQFAIGMNELEYILMLLNKDKVDLATRKEVFIANYVKDDIKEKLLSVIDKGGYSA